MMTSKLVRLILSSICFILLVTTTVVASASNSQEVEVSSTGITREEAIYTGLIEAIRQVNGVEVSSQTQTSFEYAEFSTIENNHNLDISSGSNKIAKEIYSKTNGLISNYEIIEIRQRMHDWEANLLVSVHKYKTPGISPHSLRKIAVIPFNTKTSSMSILDDRVSSDEISRQFNQKLVTELTQSRRFTVLDREYVTEYLKERDLVLSADAPISEQMKIGEVLGVDYLLLGTISDFGADRTSTYIKVLKETVQGARANFSADFRIMVMATRQIKWSDTVNVTAKSGQLKNAMNNSGVQGVIDFMLEKAASNVIHASLDNIYPLKILKVVANDAIYLNQGGKITHIDDVYEVYTKGENIVDPDTGLNIKIDGSKVATVKIKKVLAKYSLATLLEGDITNIEKGAILRKYSAASAEPDRAEKLKVRRPNW